MNADVNCSQTNASDSDNGDATMVNTMVLTMVLTMVNTMVLTMVNMVNGCTVCKIFAFILYCDLETWVWGHSRSSKMALFDRAHMTLYSSSIVMPLSSTLSKI